MKKRYQITEEEFAVIKETISKVLNLHQYDGIKAEALDDSGASMAMSAETFFKSLRDEFIIDE